MPTTIPTTRNAPKTYQVVLTAAQLATLQDALAAEVEHARDAAKDATGDPADVARYLAIAERNETLRRQLGEVTAWFALERP